MRRDPARQSAETVSADNYLYVGRVGNGRYGLWHCFASDNEPLRGNRPRETFDTADAAIKAAHNLDQQEYHEYGVQIEPEVHSEWVAT